MKCCKSKEERYDEVKTITHNERIATAALFKYKGMGMIVAGLGCFAGLTGSLWNQLGAGALGAGFGSASGLLFGSCYFFQYEKDVLEWDRMIENGEDAFPSV